MNYYCYGEPKNLCEKKKSPSTYGNHTVIFTGTKSIGEDNLYVTFREEDAPLLPCLMLTNKWNDKEYRFIRMAPVRGFGSGPIPTADEWYKQVGKEPCAKSLYEYAIEFCRNHNEQMAEAWSKSDYQYVVFTWAYLLKNELQEPGLVPKSYHYNYMVPQDLRELMERQLLPYTTGGQVFVSNQVLPLYEFLHSWKGFHDQATMRFLRNERYIVHKYDIQEYNPGELFVPYYAIPVSFTMKVPFAFPVQWFIHQVETILQTPLLPAGNEDALLASIAPGIVSATNNLLTAPGNWNEFASYATGEGLAELTRPDASAEERKAYAELLAEKQMEVHTAEAIEKRNQEIEAIKARKAEQAKPAQTKRRGVLECLSQIFRK